VQRLEALELVAERGQHHASVVAVADDDDVRRAGLTTERAHELAGLADREAAHVDAEQLEHAAQRHGLARIDVDQVDRRPAVAGRLDRADPRGPQAGQVGTFPVAGGRGQGQVHLACLLSRGTGAARPGRPARATHRARQEVGGASTSAHAVAVVAACDAGKTARPARGEVERRRDALRGK